MSRPLQSVLAPPLGIDHDQLRSFVYAAECGSLTLAAYRMGYTMPAISFQIRKLEELLGQQLLVRRTRRGLVTTPHGAWLLARARPLLEAQDGIVAAFRAPKLTGTLRLGVPEDYAQPWLPRILARFADTCPDVTVELTAAPSASLAERVEAGDLDLALEAVLGPAGAGEDFLWQARLAWIGPQRHDAHRHRILPLAVAQPHCLWRRAAQAALDQCCAPWRIVAVTAATANCLPLVGAGLMVTVGLPVGLPPELRVLGKEEGMPKLPEFGFRLLRGVETRAGGLLAEQIGMIFRRGAGVDPEMDALLAPRV